MKPFRFSVFFIIFLLGTSLYSHSEAPWGWDAGFSCHYNFPPFMINDAFGSSPGAGAFIAGAYGSLRLELFADWYGYFPENSDYSRSQMWVPGASLSWRTRWNHKGGGAILWDVHGGGGLYIRTLLFSGSSFETRRATAHIGTGVIIQTERWRYGFFGDVVVAFDETPVLWPQFRLKTSWGSKS